ncbi:hypothetical protein MNB_SM-3-241 [hydrothermal vent metagenome]|uniref:Uncharacterized protein n=1 Tax=hydrothermal vent metagenome TaxID=652676 RepID=A0A1W1D337_9ZZZZ
MDNQVEAVETELSVMDKLSKKVNSVIEQHKAITAENENLKNEIVSLKEEIETLKNEIAQKNEKIEALVEDNEMKELELEDIVSKIESILG